ncbi:MAG: hypothetical protein IJ251_00800 [Oscillospiraceae bacterium]|nr:hypothetical protein [Oscillospiraceae bacterium]
MQIIPYLEYSLYQMFFIFIFWSVIGWMIEVVDMTYETGAYQNRGFLNGPLCPIYGVGVLMMLILFRPLKDTYIPLFIVSTVLCTAFEFFMGWLMETAFHMRWWDYSHMRFNIKGYICLRNSLFFGSGCVVVYHWAEPLLEAGIARIPVKAGFVLITVISLLMVIDIVSSFSTAIKLGVRLRRLNEISARMLAVSQATGMKLADGTLAVKSGIDKAKDNADSVYLKAQTAGSAMRDRLEEFRDNATERVQGIASSAQERVQGIASSAQERVQDLADSSRENIERLRAEYERLKEEYEKLLSGDIETDRFIRRLPRMISRNYARSLRAIKRRLHIRRINPRHLYLISTTAENEEDAPDEIAEDKA